MATALPYIIRGCSLVCMTTGALNVAYGVNMLGGSSVFTPQTQSSALADSQIRYLGAFLATAAVIGWWTSNDLSGRQVPLALLGAGMFAGGFGRLLAGLKHGFGPNMKIAMGAELVAPVLIYVFGTVVGQW